MNIYGAPSGDVDSDKRKGNPTFTTYFTFGKPLGLGGQTIYPYLTSCGFRIELNNIGGGSVEVFITDINNIETRLSSRGFSGFPLHDYITGGLGGAIPNIMIKRIRVVTKCNYKFVSGWPFDFECSIRFSQYNFYGAYDSGIRFRKGNTVYRLANSVSSTGPKLIVRNENRIPVELALTSTSNSNASPIRFRHSNGTVYSVEKF